MKQKLYRYYCPMREPAPGAVPKNGMENVYWYGCRQFVEIAGREVWGWVEYNRELSEKEVSNYELIKGF